MIYHAKEVPIDCAHWLTSQKPGDRHFEKGNDRPAAPRLAHLEEHRSAEREVVGSNPGRTMGHEIMLAVIWHLVSVKMIASLGGDDRLLAFSLHHSFIGQIKGDVKETTLLLEKSWGSFPGGVIYLSRIAHPSYHGLWAGYSV